MLTVLTGVTGCSPKGLGDEMLETVVTRGDRRSICNAN